MGRDDQVVCSVRPRSLNKQSGAPEEEIVSITVEEMGWRLLVWTTKMVQKVLALAIFPFPSMR